MSGEAYWRCPRCGELNELEDAFEHQEGDKIGCPHCRFEVEFSVEYNPYYSFYARFLGASFNVSANSKGWPDNKDSYEEVERELKRMRQ